jgi:hypothetical protein
MGCLEVSCVAVTLTISGDIGDSTWSITYHREAYILCLSFHQLSHHLCILLKPFFHFPLLSSHYLHPFLLLLIHNIHPRSLPLSLLSSFSFNHPLFRKQAERAARGKQSTRRANYFDSMVVDYLARELEKQPDGVPSPSPSVSLPLSSTPESVVRLDERMACTYPWDDSPSVDQDTVSSHTQAPTTTTSSTTSRNSSLPATRPFTSVVPAAAPAASSSLTVAESRTVTTSVPLGHTHPSAPSSVCDLTSSEDKNTDIDLPPSTGSEEASLSSGSSFKYTQLPLSLGGPAVPQPAQLKNYFSLFWLKRSSLPCVRTDWADENVRAPPILILFCCDLSSVMSYDF